MSSKGIGKIILKIALYLFLVLLLIVISATLFIYFHPTFGDSPDVESMGKIKSSRHYQDGKFNNLVPTKLMTPNPESDYSITGFFFPPDGKNPKRPLPSKELDPDKIVEGTFTWLGHASILMKTNGITILTDPVYHTASPIKLGGDPFELTNPIVLDDLPKINAIVISHDHYDHLEYEGIRQFASKVDQFFVPLGVKAHVMKWGVDKNKIIEMDWYESTTYRGVKFTLVPSRHFSGRGITDGYSTLWGGWVFKSDKLNVYFSGDTGYFEEFKKIGKKYGPFDISFIDTGAYDKAWANVHMFPEESVQASIDLSSKVYFPIGWSRFDLAVHYWDDPIIRATEEAQKRDVAIATPLIGETFVLDVIPQSKWWEEMRL